MRKLENLVLNINEKGMQVRTTADFPAGEFGTIYAPHYKCKTDGYIAIQKNQDKVNTIFSAYNINKTFEGTTRLMIYEEL